MAEFEITEAVKSFLATPSGQLAAYRLTMLSTAASLAMDAFSVSICIGLAHGGRLKLRQALLLGGSFGFYQVFMPLLGSVAARMLPSSIDHWIPWIAAALVAYAAYGMFAEARKGEDGEESNSAFSATRLDFKNVMILALATSLDALSVGFSLAATAMSVKLLAVAAGIITFALSFLGAVFGDKIGKKTGKRAQYFGAAVLFIIALSIIYRSFR